MARWLSPLRAGQRFRLREGRLALAAAHDPAQTGPGALFRLGRPIPAQTDSRRLMSIDSTDVFEVVESWWALGTGWYVRGRRLCDGRELGFIQFIRPELWLEHYRRTARFPTQPKEATEVIRVARADKRSRPTQPDSPEE
jgi:hypothetical protein